MSSSMFLEKELIRRLLANIRKGKLEIIINKEGGRQTFTN